jgi:UDP-glucose 4-epimerase
MGQPTLSGRNVLVTGGAGFIGSHLVRALVPENEVRVLDDCSTGDPSRLPDRVTFVEGDVRDSAALARAGEGIDLIYHLAANVSVERSVREPVWSNSVNVGGTLAVLEFAREQGARVVFASSAAVYGDPAALPVAEADPMDPLSPYGIEKSAGDGYVRRYADLYDVDGVVLRFFNVFGPGQSSEYAGVITAFVENAAAGQPLTVHGDGEQTRDFVHVDDVVRACLLAATTDHVGEAFNVGSGRAVSVNELAETVLEAAGSSAGVVHTDPRPGDIDHSRADIAKARDLLGYEPTVALADGIRPLIGVPQ